MGREYRIWYHYIKGKESRFFRAEWRPSDLILLLRNIAEILTGKNERGLIAVGARSSFQLIGMENKRLNDDR